MANFGDKVQIYEFGDISRIIHQRLEASVFQTIGRNNSLLNELNGRFLTFFSFLSFHISIHHNHFDLWRSNNLVALFIKVYNSGLLTDQPGLNRRC